MRIGLHALLSAAASASQLALTGTLLPPAHDMINPYGSRLEVEPSCLVSGQLISGTGRAQYCVDVPEATGQKLVVTVKTPARVAAEAVRIGSQTYLRGRSNSTVEASISTSTAVGPLIEVKPFQQSCERCDLCPCIGCGHRCECSCNAFCRLRRETSCAHTAGVLSPGRWYVGIDAPGDFTLRATLVSALALRAGEILPPRTLWGAGATQLHMDEGESEGKAFSDFFYYDPRPHEKMALTLTLLRTGSASSWVDVYVRFGDWPTTEIHDATMRCSRDTQLSTFVMQADRLLNERLCVLVVGRGDSSIMYTLSTKTDVSGRLLGALFLVGLVGLATVSSLIWICSKPDRGASPGSGKSANTMGGAGPGHGPGFFSE